MGQKYVYLTAGSCGACRFGQYHQSYELGLRNAGLDAFRMLLMAQDQMDQKAAMGDGIDLNLPMTLGCLWGIFCTDLDICNVWPSSACRSVPVAAPVAPLLALVRLPVRRCGRGLRRRLRRSRRHHRGRRRHRAL